MPGPEWSAGGIVLDAERATAENYDEVMDRMEQYMGEFEAHGTDHINVDME